MAFKGKPSMVMQNESDSLTTAGRVIQLICASLIFGVLTFAIVIGVIVGFNNINSDLGIMTLIGIVIAATTYGLSFVVPAVAAKGTLESVRTKFKKSGESLDSPLGYEKLAGIFNTSVILRYALIEGSIFLNLVVFFLEKSSYSLMISAIGIILMVVCFPFPGRMVDWIENRIGSL